MKTALTATHWGNFLVNRGEKGEIVVRSADGGVPTSPIARSLADTHDPKCRIAAPLVREGYLRGGAANDTRRRGMEPFVAIGWDEALDLVSSALLHTRERKGNQAIYGGSYGWASAGRFHHAQSQIHRFLRAFGGYTDCVNTYSFAAGEVIIPHVLGMNAFVAAMEAPTIEEIVKHTKSIVFFGGAALKNTFVNPGGVGRQEGNDYFGRVGAAGVKVVNVSPLRDDVAGSLNAHWWACRPNSDVAVMLAMSYTLLNEGLHDRAFLDRYCVGFGTFADYLLGKHDGIPKDPEWAEKLSEIGANDIRKLAREMREGRSLIGLSLSVQRAEHGEQVYWAGIALAAMLGHLGLPGGGLLIAAGVGKMHFLGRRALPFSIGALPQGENPVRDYIPVARLTEMLERPGENFSYNGQTLTYPDIDLIYWAGGNPFHHHQDIPRLRRAWSRPRTIITHEIFWTQTARQSDIILPATSPLEREDFAGGSADNWLTPMRQVLSPFGEARDDYTIFAALAARLGFGEEFTEGLDARGWIKRLYGVTQENARGAGVDLPDFESFFSGSPIDLSPQIADAEFLIERFRRNPDAHPIATPSGKIELFSQTISDFGYSDCMGHPAWYEKSEWLGSPLAAEFPFHLLSNQPANRLHSQLDHGAASRETKIRGREPLRMNRQDADALGIADGDIVRIFNRRGAMLAGAMLTENVRQGVLQIATGALYDMLDAADPGSLEVHGNPNAVTRDAGTSSLSQGPSSNSCLVNVERFDRPLPPVKAFEPPEIIARLA